MTKSEYDYFASQFDQTRSHAWPEFQLLFPHIKQNDHICDLGCGNGRLRKFLDPKVIPPGNYTGLDISEELLTIAKNKYTAETFIQESFTNPLPFPNGSFEIVTAIASFHHILNHSEQLLFLEECHRILKPSGTLFFTTWILPKKHKWPNYLKGRYKNWNIPFGKQKHPRTYRNVTKKELKRILGKSHFSKFKITEFTQRNRVILAQKSH